MILQKRTVLKSQCKAIMTTRPDHLITSKSSLIWGKKEHIIEDKNTHMHLVAEANSYINSHSRLRKECNIRSPGAFYSKLVCLALIAEGVAPTDCFNIILTHSNKSSRLLSYKVEESKQVEEGSGELDITSPSMVT